MADEQRPTPLELASDAEVGQEESLQSTGDPVVVYTTGSSYDGEIVRGILETEGIPVILTQAASPILGEVFENGEGQAGEILVAPQDALRAEALIAAYSDTDKAHVS